MGTLVDDPFTEGSDTDLVNHTPNTAGTGWTLEEQDAAQKPVVNAAGDHVAFDSVGFNRDSWTYTAQPNPCRRYSAWD